MRSADELSAKSRIREAAIARFATDGVDAPLRAIATDAGVSPGLILHHFGSRDGLREACDEHVLAVFAGAKADVVAGEQRSGILLTQLAHVEGYAPIIGYVLRCLQAGGDLTDRFVALMTQEVVEFLDAGVAAGTIRPSRRPGERAKLLTDMGLGALLLQLPARSTRLDLTELPAWLRTYTESIVVPLLEFYTEPLFTDSTLLDAYLAHTNGSTP